MVSPFGLLLRRLRQQAKMTLEELSEASGVSVRAISDMERGKSRGPQRRTVEALVEALQPDDDQRAALIETARAGRPRPTNAPPGACELPRGIGDFTGRTQELELLRRLAGQAGDGQVALVAAISGTAGLGKTALAVHAAGHLADSFPDGRHYIDLRGMDALPLDPAVALSRLLKAMGVPERRIPADEEERAGHYRALQRDRRCLVVLDNAAHEQQVRPLLPADGPGMTIVTSRKTLTGLEGVHQMPLTHLAPDEATALLGAIVGAGRAATDPDGIARVAYLCENLPLALRIAGNRLQSRPSWTAAQLAARLTDEERRVESLAAGDLSVSAALALSYRQLSPPARLGFRRLALATAPDFGAPLTAVLTGTGLGEAEDTLEELVDLGLLQSPYPGRYRFHDLVRLFARARLSQEEPIQAQRQVRRRMDDWLLEVATVAGRWFEPGYGAPPPDWDSLVSLDSADQAAAWLEQEGPAWLAALKAVAADGEHRRVVEVAEAMHWFSDRWIHWGHWHEVYGLSADAAAALDDDGLDDDGLVAEHANYLAWALTMCEGRHEDAIEAALHGLELAARSGDVRQQGWALQYAGSAARDLQDGERGADFARRAAAYLLQAGDLDGYPQAMGTVADCLLMAGQAEQALDHLETLLTTLRDPAYGGSPNVREISLGLTLGRVGRTCMALGRWSEAVAHLEEALPLLRRQGMGAGCRAVLYDLGRTLRELGRTADARRVFDEAADIYESMGEKDMSDRIRLEAASMGT
ncbi:ATP-binding protein [Nocardiopsis sp. NPDC057823]|uniref:ATP-binding protein n=1 Tax=Nocardiopsis sp. NPDC057823 TaxID=3346256 RepID=UPI00366B1234